MSSSFRSLTRVGWLGWLSVAHMAVILPAAAQEVAFVPQGNVSAEWASNRSLTVPAAPNSELYRATVGGDLIRRTLVSDLDFRPLLSVQHDNQISSFDSFEALVDLVGDYRTLRSESSVIAEYHRQDSYNSQYGISGFNPLNPNAPDTTGGTIVTGNTKSSFEVAPELSYDLTQRVSLSGSADLLAVRYTTEVPGQLVSYNSPQVDLALGWALSPTTRVELGPYYAYYNPVHDTEGAVKTTTWGAALDYVSRFSRVSQFKITARVERDTEPAAFGAPSFSQTNWGLEWVGSHKFLTSQIQYSIGKFLQPNSAGGRSELDQFRVQYNKLLTQRWSVNAAVRLTRESDIGTVVLDNNNTRDRANAQLIVSYLLTPEWFISGGYRYARLKDTSATEAANSNGVIVSFGYHGLQPPRD